MSSGLADRRIGARVFHSSCACVQSAVNGVSTSPGATAFTRMSGASDSASKRVMWLSAAFVTEYGIDAPLGRTPACELMLITLPGRPRRAASRNAGSASAIKRNGAITLISWSSCQTVGVAAARSACGITRLIPALLTRTSSRPHAATDSRTRRTLSISSAKSA